MSFGLSENKESAMENYFEIALEEEDLRGISSIGLAHLGDAVFELLVRTWLCAHGKATGRGLHQATIRLVCAESQAEKAQRILPALTEESWRFSSGAAMPRCTRFPAMPAGPSTARPPHWRRCWVGCTCEAAGSGSTSFFV